MDITTGKIYGCKEGTWKYYHEVGHTKFGEIQFNAFVVLLREFAFRFWMIAVMFAIMFKPAIWFMVGFWVLHTLMDVYEEKWCNDYADTCINSKNKHL